MSDGKITFCTKIDNSQVDKDLKEVKRKIQKSEEDIRKAEIGKDPLVKQSEKIGAALDEAKAKLASFQKEAADIDLHRKEGVDPADFLEASARKPQVDADIKTQEKQVAGLQKQWDGVNDKIDRYDAKIRQATAALHENRAKAGELEAKLSKGGNLHKVFDKAQKSAGDLGKRLLSIGKSALVFSAIYAGLRGVATHMNKVLNTNEQYRAQLAKLKGALLTAFQPIYTYVLPGILAVLRMLTALVSVVARVFAAFSGKSMSQHAKNAEVLNKEADAIAAVGGAVAEAQKDLAGFDEINRLSAPDSGGGGGPSGVQPDFSDFENLDDDAERLRKIAKLVLAIGAGLLGWKIARMFTEDLKTVAGIAMAVGGAFLYAFSWADAFTNGIDWGNLTGMLAGLALAAGGLFLAFGPMGAAVALLAGGVGLLVVAIKDFIETGELSNATFAALEAGIFAVGGGLALMTGSWIPLLIAAAVGAVVAIVAKGDEMKAWLQGLDDWLQNVFSTDWEYLFGPILCKPVEQFFGAVKEIWGGIKRILDGLIDFIQGVFTKDWQKAWEGVKNIFGGVFQALIGLAKAPFNSIISLMNALLEFIFAGLNKIGGAVGSLPGVSFKPWATPQIPYLARGAVLPPNKPFMAVVGDQTHGTNVEAPLETIKQAVAEVLAGGRQDALLEEIIGILQEILARCGVYIDGKDLARIVTKYQRQAVRAGGG